METSGISDSGVDLEIDDEEEEHKIDVEPTAGKILSKARFTLIIMH